MKHYLLTLLFFQASFLAFSQNGINQMFTAINYGKGQVKTVSPFSIKHTNAVTSNLFAEGFTPITLEVSQKMLEEIKPSTNLLNMSVPLTFTNTIELELYAVNIFSPDFKVFDANKREIPYRKGQFFHGRIKGDTTSIAAISILDGEISGIISDATGSRTLKKQRNASNYLLYYEHNLKDKPNYSCNTVDTPLEPIPNRPITNGVIGCKVVKIALEADFALFQKYGSDVNATHNYVVSLFNQVAILFKNENIAIQLSSLLIWNTQDPYAASNNHLITVLNNFKTILGTNFNGNLSHLLSGRGLGGGIANGFLGLCDKTTAHAVSGNLEEINNVPVFSLSVQIVTHEMGHNFGSRHTHACVWNGNNTPIDGCYSTEGGCPGAPIPPSGTIMSYCHLKKAGIAFSNGFGPQPGSLIRSRVADCNLIETSAALPHNLSSSDISFTSAVVSWGMPITSTYFLMRYRQVGTSSWEAISILGSSYTIHNLLRGVEYEWQVAGDCDYNTFTSSAYFTTLSDAYILTGYIPNNSLCMSGNVDIDFVVTGTLNNGNDFTAQLSDSNGSFSNPVTIGTRTNSLTSGTINATIPGDIVARSGYRIRVVSSSTIVIAINNGDDITINAIPDAPVAPAVSRCGPGTLSLIASGCSNGTISWYGTATGTTALATGGTFVSPSISTNTDYYVACTVGTCTSSITTVSAVLNINLSFTNPSQASGIYRASQTITSATSAAGPTYYYAGEVITLSPGFQVGAGEVFSAVIQNCL